MDMNKVCPHCMNEVNGQSGMPCPRCGHILGQKTEVTHQLKPFTILQGKYLVGDVLGEGGFGITYIGFDLNLEIKVAIKEFYPNGYAARESMTTNTLMVYSGQNAETVYKWRENFLKEARSLGKCSHLSGVVGVRDFFQENNTAYIVLEYLEGMTLKSYAKSFGGRLPAATLLPALEPVLVALGEVHKQGLIHRDISPDNIMLLPGGQMKLLDFGAARDYTEGNEKSLSVLLKPGYAPEEQYRSKGKQGPWTDIYALAGTIYKCLTGVTPPEAMERMRSDGLRSPNELGAGLNPVQEAALLKAMAVFAEERYRTMAEFRKDLYASPVTAGMTNPGFGGTVPMENPVSENMNQHGQEGTMSAMPASEDENRKSVKEFFGKYKNILTGAAAGFVVICAVLLIVKMAGGREKDPAQLASGTGAASQNHTVPEKEEPPESIPEGTEPEPPAQESTEPGTLESAGTAVSEPEGGDETGTETESGAEAVLTPEEMYVYSYIMYTFGIDEETAMANFYNVGPDFRISAGTQENYGQDFSYMSYNEGFGDFHFWIPENLYNTAIYGNASNGNIRGPYGKMAEYFMFCGSHGSSLIYSLTERDDSMSLEDMTDYVYVTECSEMVEPSKIVLNTYEEHGRAIVTGYNSDKTFLIYDLSKIEQDYVLQMKVIFPGYLSEYDQYYKDYMTEVLYRACGFSGNTKEMRSFQEYVEANTQ